MKTLVVFYSRTGNNKKIAEELAKATKADIDEIVDKKNRKGRLNWLRAGRDSMNKKTTEIESKKNPNDYDLIVLCTPSAPMCAVLTPVASADRLRTIAFPPHSAVAPFDYSRTRALRQAKLVNHTYNDYNYWMERRIRPQFQREAVDARALLQARMRVGVRQSMPIRPPHLPSSPTYSDCSILAHRV